MERDTQSMRFDGMQMINERLTIDEITAMRIKCDKIYTKPIKTTWESMLRKEGELPENWIGVSVFLVGRRPSMLI
jgi:hypothetical protein